MSDLPAGFVLDEAPSPKGGMGLPAGFVLDEPKKTSIGDASKTMLRHGASFGLSDEADGARAKRAETFANIDEGRTGIGKYTGMARNFVLGAKPPAFDDIAHGVEGVISENTGGATDTYTQARDARRGEVAKAREDRPLTSFASEAAPSLLIPAGKVAQGVGWVGKTLAGAKSAAPLGMMYGFGEGEGDLGDRAKSAAYTGIASGAGGAALGSGAHFAGKAWQSVFPKTGGDVLETVLVDANPVVRAKASARLEKALASAGVTSDDIGRSLLRFHNGNQQGDVRLPLASFLKKELGELYPEVGQTLDNVVKELGQQNPTLFKSKIDAIKTGQADRFSQRMDDITYKESLNARDTRLGEDLRDIGAEFYEPALSGGPVDAAAAQELKTLLRDPDFIKEVPKSFLTRLTARRNPNVEVPNGISGSGGTNTPHLTLEQAIENNPLRVAHEIYSNLGQKARKAVGSEAIGFSELRKVLKDPLFRAGGKLYNEGNAKYRNVAQSREALDFGNRLKTQSKSTRQVDELANEFNELPAGKIQTSAIASIRDVVKDAARSAKEGDLVTITQLRKDGFLDAVERILDVKKLRGNNGRVLPKDQHPDKTIGQNMAEEIRNLIREAEDLQAWSKRPNKDVLKDGRQAYAGKAARGAHNGQVFGFGNILQDTMLSGMAGQALPVKTALALAEKGVARMASPSRKVREAMLGSLLDHPNAPRVTPRAAKATPSGGNSGGGGGIPPRAPQSPPSGPVAQLSTQNSQPAIAGPAPQNANALTTLGQRMPAQAANRQEQQTAQLTRIPSRPQPVQASNGVQAKLQQAKRQAANRHAKAEALRVKARGKANIESAKLEAKQAKIGGKLQKKDLKVRTRAERQKMKLDEIARQKELDRMKVADEVHHLQDMTAIERARPARQNGIAKAARNAWDKVELPLTTTAITGATIVPPALGLKYLNDAPKRKRADALKALDLVVKGQMKEDEALSIINAKLGTDFKSLEELRSDPALGVAAANIMSGEPLRVKNKAQPQ